MNDVAVLANRRVLFHFLNVPGTAAEQPAIFDMNFPRDGYLPGGTATHNNVRRPGVNLELGRPVDLELALKAALIIAGARKQGQKNNAGDEGQFESDVCSNHALP